MSRIICTSKELELSLSPQLRDKGVNRIYYDVKRKLIIILLYNGKSLNIKIENLVKKGPAIFDELVNGDLDDQAKEGIRIKVFELLDVVKKEYPDITIDKKQEPTKTKLSIENLEKYTEKLFVDEYKIPYAVIQIEDHLEVLPINSKHFTNLCRMKIYEQEGRIMDNQAINDVSSLLTAQAHFGHKEQINLQLRTASRINNEELVWYYDLTNKNWEFIKITSTGWSVVNNEIQFKRYNNQQPQVTPSREYEPDTFDQFMKLVNIRANDEESKLILQVYIISLLIPDIQKPVLMLHGSEGSAKSSLQEMIKMIVDPSAVKTFSFPRDINELQQQLNHNYVVFFDNISIIKDHISDELCRAVTGSGSLRRQLYTDDDDMIFNFKRCIGFNGINLGATKADLLDRGLIIELERIAKNNRLKPEDLWKRFDELRPKLLGYILDILVKVLKWKNNPDNQKILDELPRMAEFAECGEIISRCMGNPHNKFIEAYEKNMKLKSQQVIDSSLVASAIVELMSNINEWSGTATELLAILESHAEALKINTNSKAWVGAPNKLSQKLNEIKENLKEVGIEIENKHINRKRILTIRKVSSLSSYRHQDENQARIDNIKSDDTSDDTESYDDDESSLNNDENHAQNDTSDDSDDKNDTLQSLIPISQKESEPKTKEVLYECYPPGCGFSTNNQEEYDIHNITNHRGLPGYPNEADFERHPDWKRQGKEWEKPVDSQKMEK